MMAVALASVLSTSIEDRARQQAEDAALMAVRLGLQPQLTPEDLAAGFDAHRLASVEQAVDERAAPLLTQCRDVAVTHDGKQPGARVAALKSVEAAERAQHGVLHDVVCMARRGRQPPREAIRRIEVRQYLRLESLTFVSHV